MNSNREETKEQVLQLLAAEPGLTRKQIAARLQKPEGTMVHVLNALLKEAKISTPGKGTRMGYRLVANEASQLSLVGEVMPTLTIQPEEQTIRARIEVLQDAQARLAAHLKQLADENRYLLHLEQLLQSKAELEKQNAELISRCQQLQEENTRLKNPLALNGLDYIRLIQNGVRCIVCDNLVIPGCTACAKHISNEQKALFIGAVQQQRQAAA